MRELHWRDSVLSATPEARAKRLLLASAICAFIGIVCLGVAAFLSLQPDDPDCSDFDNPQCAVYDPNYSRRGDFELEKIGGKALVFTVHFNKWAAEWLHGQKLGLLLGVIALVVALWCFRESRDIEADAEEADAESSRTGNQAPEDSPRQSLPPPKGEG